ncbi:MAG: hypothetical protein ACYTHN_21730, partial [Planctomycetota bacterium]
EKYDAVLTANLLSAIRSEGFRGLAINPVESGATVKDLIEVAREKGCAALYLVHYNEFKKLRFRTQIRRHRSALQHRIRELKGSAIIPSVALFLVPEGKSVMARSDTGRRGQRYNDYFWSFLITFGRSSPFDEDTGSLVRFLNKVSAGSIEEARPLCAAFLVDRDFTPKPASVLEEMEEREKERAKKTPPKDPGPGDEKPTDLPPEEPDPGEEGPTDLPPEEPGPDEEGPTDLPPEEPGPDEEGPTDLPPEEPGDGEEPQDPPEEPGDGAGESGE